MNEVLQDVIPGDAFTEAATLGPEPGQADGVDIRIGRADVLMQFADVVGGGGVWIDREYAMRPGTRHVGNVVGVRFRNKNVGAQALINAALTGPDKPLLGPIIPDNVTGIGDPFIATSALIGSGGAGTGVDLGTFDPGDWPYLLLGLQGDGNALHGCLLSARYQNVPVIGAVAASSLASSTLEVFGNLASGLPLSGFLVVPNLSELLTLRFRSNTVQFGEAYIYAAPCGFDRQSQWQDFAEAPQVLLHMANTAVPATSTFLSPKIPPYKGQGQTTLVFQAGGGPMTVNLVALDYTGAQIGVLASQSGIATAAAASVMIEHPLVSAPMQWQVTNPAAGNGAVSIDTVRKETS